MGNLLELCQRNNPKNVVVIGHFFKDALNEIVEAVGEPEELTIVSPNHLDCLHFASLEYNQIPVKNTRNILSIRVHGNADLAYIQASDEEHAYHNCVLAIDAVKHQYFSYTEYGAIIVKVENQDVKNGVEKFCEDYRLKPRFEDDLAIIRNTKLGWISTHMGVGWMEDFECHFMNHDIPMKKWLDKTLESHMTILDIGANQGEYTRLFYRKVIKYGGKGKVIAFEPSPTDCEWLRKQFHNVTIEQMALGNQIGTVPFCHFNDLEFHGYDSLRAPTTFDKEYSTIQVEINTLDNYLDKNPQERIDHVKVDIEGGEMDFFRGATRLWDYRPTIQVEISDARTADFDYKAYEIVQLLHHHDYDIYVPDEDGNLVDFEPEGKIIEDCVALPKECGI